jgi:amino acid adenylation domain-containing protein
MFRTTHPESSSLESEHRSLYREKTKTNVGSIPATSTVFKHSTYDGSKFDYHEFNKTKSDYPKDMCITDLFLQDVRIQPDHPAVLFADQKLTYLELAEASMNLGRILQNSGVTPDVCVGIFVEPSIELMIGTWGILFSGGAYLPLSPEYPEDRIKYMIEDSGIQIVLTQSNLKEKLRRLAPKMTRIITFEDIIEFKQTQASCTDLRTDLQPKNLAYVIYTSGSTGKPKGVMIEHRSIVNQMHWLKTTFRLNPKTIILQKTPMSFDAAQWEILAPTCGGTVAMGSPGIYRNPAELAKAVTKYQVTALQCVPTLLQALLDLDEFKECKSLTQIFSGGEALSKTLSLECIRTLPQCVLVNLYGPTECTINSSAHVIDPNTIENSSNTIPIGKPVNNTQYYILGEHGTPLSAGEIGELYIGGVGLARGYLHRPDLTAEKFVDDPFNTENGCGKLYRTGDLGFWSPDGSVQYAGRTDNQVKLRGFRVELDEIKSAIESLEWIKSSAVILKNDPHTGYQNLIAFVELNPKEAALMDQGNHGAHHQSKESKAQVMMQLSNKGCREERELTGKKAVDLPGRIASEKQKQVVFARKSYRFYDGGTVMKSDLLQLLQVRFSTGAPIQIEELTFEKLGEIIRYFGQYVSEERLLSKYGYASPGALYATQMYFELSGIGSLKPGYYYYHPLNHQLVLIQSKAPLAKADVKIHFIGKKCAIEPIYKNNILEVLEMETGHILGLFDRVLPEYGLSIVDFGHQALVKTKLEVADEDYYLGTFQLVPAGLNPLTEEVDLYVQAHPGKIPDLASGLYRYQNGNLEKISDEIILRKHVIAINQEVYNRASFGITITSKTSQVWKSYVDLGRKLQQLQMNDRNLGLMSSGYSSKTGNDLPSAKRIREIVGAIFRASYFAIGGRISEEQKISRGMKEDTVHMKGPAEMIKDDLANFMPDYMVPNKVIVLDKIPQTANGKIDYKALSDRNVELERREFISPRSDLEEKVCQIWKAKLKREIISINENFFELGGTSLVAVNLIGTINKELNASLTLQAIFQAPTIEKLAQKLSGSDSDSDTTSRLVPLQVKGAHRPIYCWPGLGGYCMNFRLLATKVAEDRPFYGIQAYGINPNEIPYASIQEMAAEDIKMIKKRQPSGPYTLWGYSFGAKVAFEAAYQLENSGDIVENLILIAPGSPKFGENRPSNHPRKAKYCDANYLPILFSVFAGTVTGDALEECLNTVSNKENFVQFIRAKNSNLEPELISRITDIVAKTYEFGFTSGDLESRRLKGPITIFKARGDDYSFIENSSGFLPQSCCVVELKSDHYSVLKHPDIEELVQRIHENRLKTKKEI